MADYGNSLQFGLSVTPATDGIEQIAEFVELADETGLDLIAIQDHPYNSTYLDTWTLISHLAARTERVRFFPDVANLALRPPAMLAKAAATLDMLSKGRIELGIGSGAYWDAIVAMGGKRLSPAEAVEATEEAIQVFRLAWGTQRGVSFEGRHYQLHGYQPGPTPIHPIGIWVGALKPRMLDLIGRRADGWVAPLNIYLPPEQAPAAQATIDEGARTAGRDPSEIRRIANVLGSIDAGRGGRGLHGSSEEWAQTLATWATEIGFDMFVFWTSIESREQVERFARQVVPRTRELVEQARRS